MRNRYPKRSQLKYTKQRYRVRNWPQYESGLRKRGDLTLWFAEDVIAAWRAPATNKAGAQPVYSDLAIETALTVRLVYGLALRQTEGFLQSVSRLLALDLRIPDHTTLSRRAKHLDIRLRSVTTDSPVSIFIDSTGLRAHSGNSSGVPPKRRAWRKLHLVVDADNGNVLASLMTTDRARDGAQVAPLLTQIRQSIESAMADGAYDASSVYAAFEKHSPGIRIIIPPRHDAKTNGSPSSQRDLLIHAIDTAGRRKWAHASGFTRRSLVETAMYRYKTIIGRTMRSRNVKNQQTESRLACAVINQMRALGMPNGFCTTQDKGRQVHAMCSALCAPRPVRVRTRCYDRLPVQGLSTVTPAATNSLVLRDTTTRPLCAAVAAIRTSG